MDPYDFGLVVRWIEVLTIPVEEVLMIFVGDVAHGFEEELEARRTADILRRGSPLTINETRQTCPDLHLEQGDDSDLVLPVIAEVVGIE